METEKITQHMSEQKIRYWGAPADSRKMSLMFIGNMWKALLGIAAGALLGALIYFGYRALTDGSEYSGYSEFYLDFAFDEAGEAYDYYNGYTWNDLMSTDPIAKLTLEGLGADADAAYIEKTTRADILSDIRVLRVTFTTGDRQSCADLQSATEDALVRFGGEVKEFTGISVIKSVEPSALIGDERLPQAVLLGAIIGLMITLIAMRCMYILDDRIYVPSDIEYTGLKLLGVRTADSDKGVESRLGAVFGEPAETDGDDAQHLDASAFADTASELPVMESGKEAVIEVPYRKVTVSALTLLKDRLEASGIGVRGVMITGADSRFYRAYYTFNPTDKR